MYVIEKVRLVKPREANSSNRIAQHPPKTLGKSEAVKEFKRYNVVI